MLEQYVKSILAYFTKVEPMNVYLQNVPAGVQYPCYLLNKIDIHTSAINAYYYLNTVTLYVRMFAKDEIDLKNKAFNLTGNIFEVSRKIAILNSDGTESNRFMRIENVEAIEIPVDENEIYCIELNFSFDTTHNINVKEFELMTHFVQTSN